jgi:hypothetical protein
LKRGKATDYKRLNNYGKRNIERSARKKSRRNILLKKRRRNICICLAIIFSIHIF